MQSVFKVSSLSQTVTQAKSTYKISRHCVSQTTYTSTLVMFTNKHIKSLIQISPISSLEGDSSKIVRGLVGEEFCLWGVCP